MTAIMLQVWYTACILALVAAAVAGTYLALMARGHTGARHVWRRRHRTAAAVRRRAGVGRHAAMDLTGEIPVRDLLGGRAQAGAR